MKSISLWFILVTAALGLFAACSSDNQKPEPVAGGVPFAYVEPADSRDSLVVEMTGVDSLTVFELLQKAVRVEYLSSVQGVFVTYIEDVGGPGDYYWVYSINGEMANVACDRLTPRNGDEVRWHFRRGGVREDQ
jgi:hypothetical protein